MKIDKTGKIIIICFLALMFLRLALFLTGEWNDYRRQQAIREDIQLHPKEYCKKHLKSLSYEVTAFRARFPKEWGVSSYAWANDIRDYYYGGEDFFCPLVKRDKTDLLPPSDYLFNRELAGKKLSEIKTLEKTVLLYETGNRHDGNNLYLFLDGHIEERK
jgi:hypothetical protein